MKDLTFRQFFGPSQRHPRACVEASFPLAAGEFRLASLEPVLTGAGLKLSETLPDEPLPLHEAVRRLACAVIAPIAPPWSSCGHAGGRAWVAIGHPYPRFAAVALTGALETIVADADALGSARAQWTSIAAGLVNVNSLVAWMIAAATIFGRDAVTLNTSAAAYQLGQGAKGLHFYELGSQLDSLTGLLLARNKINTIELLRRRGLPTTRGTTITSKEQARRVLAQVGLPCVVKPLALAKGAGVSTGLTTEAQVATAVEHALALSGPAVLIENHVAGLDHRLTVIGGELVWAYRKLPASVIGDGKSSFGELIERENSRRAAIRGGPEAYLYPVAIDDDLTRFLKDRHDAGLDTVPARGRRMEVVGRSHMGRGATLEDVTGEVHPDNRELAIRVARLFRMKTVGIDFITHDVSRSWKEGACAIIEVNGTPGLVGIGDAAQAHRMFFPNRLSGRIPLVAAIGDAGFRQVAASLFRAAFDKHGASFAIADCTVGDAGGPLIKTSRAHPAVESLFLDPEAEAAAVLCDATSVEASGLPVHRCDLLLVQEADRFAWLEGAAETVLFGKPVAGKVDGAIRALVKRFADPAQGGPLPVLESRAGKSGTFHLEVWRPHAMERAWFWREVGIEQADTTGLTTHVDLLAAVRALADKALRATGGSRLAGEFVHDELIAGWFRVTFEATLTLPARNRDLAREALGAAVERVNAICAMRVR